MIVINAEGIRECDSIGDLNQFELDTNWNGFVWNDKNQAGQRISVGLGSETDSDPIRRSIAISMRITIGIMIDHDDHDD